MNIRKKIMKLWQVKASFIDSKIDELRDVFGEDTDISDTEILNKLNEYGLNEIGKVILALSSNIHSESPNRTNKNNKNKNVKKSKSNLRKRKRDTNTESDSESELSPEPKNKRRRICVSSNAERKSNDSDSEYEPINIDTTDSEQTESESEECDFILKPTKQLHRNKNKNSNSKIECETDDSDMEIIDSGKECVESETDLSMSESSDVESFTLKPIKQLRKSGNSKKKSKSKSKVSMKQERDSDSDMNSDSDGEFEKNTNQNIPPKISEQKINPKWKIKKFNTFKFRYNMPTARIKPIKDHSDLRLLSVQSRYGSQSRFDIEYSYFEEIINDECALKLFYDNAFGEISSKPRKPKPKKNAPKPKKKQKHDYTIQCIFGDSKKVHSKSERKTAKFEQNINISLYRFEKSGNCFIVDIPYTMGIICRNEALLNDIYDTMNIRQEFEVNGMFTSISTLDFAVRYNNDGIKPLQIGKHCHLCYKSVERLVAIKCGHRYCQTCLRKRFITDSRNHCSECSTRVETDRARELMREFHDESDSEDMDLDIAVDDGGDTKEEKERRDAQMRVYKLTVRPYMFQIQSIEWMIEKERNGLGLYQYLFQKGQFKNGEIFYYSAALDRLVLTDAMPVINGGFLCEEMGLGKTIEMLAVLHRCPRKSAYSTKKKKITFTETAPRRIRTEIEPPTNKNSKKNNENENITPECGKKKRKKAKKKYKFEEVSKEYKYTRSKATLVIAPTSLIGQWEIEIDKRSAKTLKHSRYYGPNRGNINLYLHSDIVFTTYGILSNEDGNDRRKHILHRIEWHRIILDEGHTIKNGNVRQSRSVCQLKACNKWLLSGTPFNKPSDLENQLRFLGFKNEYLNAMKLKKDTYNKSVLKVIKYLMIRHTKAQNFNDRPIITLPAKSEDVIYIDFDRRQRQCYDKLYNIAKETYNSYAATGNINRGSLVILQSLYGARSACSGYIANMAKIELELAEVQSKLAKIEAIVSMHKDLSAKELYALTHDEAFNKDSECVICLDPPPDGEMLQTPCRHMFCNECIVAYLEEKPECPVCRQPCRRVQLKRPYSKEEIERENEENKKNKNIKSEKKEENDSDSGSDEGFTIGDGNQIKFDAKLKVLVSELKKLRREKPKEKSLVFTSFSKSLSCICEELDKNGIEYCTLTGDMTMQKRAKNLKLFADDASLSVFVLTVRTGAIGLTLTAANNVFMMEPTLNPALHRQAINRVYRVGQRKNVKIHTLIMKDSIEERIWEINKEKQKGEIDNNKNKSMYGNIKEDKAVTLEASEIEKLFAETENE